MSAEAQNQYTAVSQRFLSIFNTKNGELLFWIGSGLVFSKFFLQFTQLIRVPDFILTILLGSGCLLLLLRVILIFPAINEKWLVIGGLLSSFISYCLSGDTILFTSLLAIFSSAGINCQRILKFYSRILLLILFISVVFWAADGLFNVNYLSEFKDIGGVRSSRSAMIFVHPNVCAAYCFSVAIIYMLRDDVSTNAKNVIYFISLCLIFFVTGSRTSTLALLSYIVFLYVIKLIKKANLRFKCMILVVVLPLLLIILSWLLSIMLLAGSPLAGKLNSLMSGRLSLWAAQWKMVGITLFGQHAYVGKAVINGEAFLVNTVDGSYASLLYTIGIFSSIMIGLLLISWIKKSSHADNPLFISALLSIFIFAFTEWSALNSLIFISVFMLNEALSIDQRLEESCWTIRISESNEA